MFTEGLDAEALRWVQEDKHEAISNAQPRTHSSQNIKTGDWDFDSDMDDESSDTDEIYAGRHSAESSSSLPHDDISKQRLHNVVSIGHYKYTNSIAQQHYYSSDGYSGYSSSRDTAQQRPLQPRKQVDVNKYAEKEEWSDSGESFGFNGQVGRKIVGNDLPLQERYAAKVASREDGNSNADKDSMPLRANCTFQDSHSSGNFRDVNSNSEEDKHSNFPSAPPFDVCANETDHSGVDIPSINACCPPASQDLDGSFIKENSSKAYSENKIPDKHSGSSSSGQKVGKSGSLPTRLPHFHASGQGPWHCVLAYDACVRLCLHSWARGCMEAPSFLENECALLRKAFGLQQILLQSEEELLGQQSSLSCEGIITKPKKVIGKIKFQVHKVRMSPDMPSGCSISALNLPMVNVQSIRCCISNLHSLLAAEWKSLRNLRFLLCLPANSSFSRHSLACVNASTQYAKKVSTRFKVGVSSIQTQTHSSYDMSQETYTCRLKLKSTIEEEAVRMNPGSSESHTFFPDNIGDDLYVEVYDSKGKLCGRVVVQVASISDVSEKTSWWPIYLEPEHLLVGRMQVYLNYTSSSDENNEKCGSIAETVAYDVVMEVAMKAQHFRQRNLALHGSWKWLLTEFAAYFGVSDAYTKLRYLSYVMDVATPTSDCLMLIDDLLFPVITKSNSLNRLSHQENRILGEIKEQIDQVLSLVFENYKSLDESSLSGVLEVFVPPNGNPAPALASAVKLYTLIHDILSPEAQLTLCNAFQAAVKKRSKRHMLDTDEIFANTEGTLVDYVGISTAYQKMKTLCYNVVKEINTDIEIHNHHVLPSFIDLPNISASIYSVELCTRLRSFLKACPPTGLSPPVADLVIATADFQKDLASWNICPVKGGVDAKELFHLYIILWIQDKRLALLEYCKLDKVKWSGARTQHLTSPFIDEIYDRLKETLNEYEIIMCRWPEYILVLENAIADVEKAMIETLQKQYADVLTPLKNSMAPKSLGLKFMQKLTKGKKVCPYSIPDELGILLNTMKRLLDVLRPKIELQLKSWGSCIPDAGSAVAGERLSEIAVIVRSQFRSYLQAVVEKLAENTRAQSATNLKKILQESKGIVAESDVRKRMLPLKDHLTETINHIDKVLEVNVFVSVCRCLWDRLGQDVLKFLENHKENRSLCKASRATVAVLDETFASQMQKLLGNNTLQANDLEPPRSILEVRSILCKDVHKDSSYNYGVRA